MTDTSTSAAAPQISDHRPVPRGVLPKHMQTWLMVGIAAGMVAVILLAGRPAEPTRSSAPQPAALSTTSPDRLRDYQDRLRVTQARAAQEAQAAALAPPSGPATRPDVP